MFNFKNPRNTLLLIVVLVLLVNSLTMSVFAEEGTQIDIKPLSLEGNTTISMHVGDSAAFLVYGNDEGVEYLVCSSDNEKVASVSQVYFPSFKLQVTTYSIGKAVITFASKDGTYKGTCEIIVSAQPLKLNMTSVKMKKGEEIELDEISGYKDDLVWKSDNENVATVEVEKSSWNFNRITAKGAGSAVITVESEDGDYIGTCKITVYEVAISSINVPKSKSLVVGDTYELPLTYLASPEDAVLYNDDFIWKSSQPKVASVTKYGYISASSVGKTIITVKTKDGKLSSQCEITVSDIKVISVTTTKSVKIGVGEKIKLSYTILPSNATNKKVVWSSSNNNIVEISPDGVISAKKIGTSNITVKSVDGSKTSVCKIQVTIAIAKDSEGKVIHVTDTVSKGTLYGKFYGSVEKINGNKVYVYWSSVSGLFGAKLTRDQIAFAQTVAQVRLNSFQWMDATSVKIEDSGY